MKKLFASLLSALAAGLILYGHHTAGIYWDYSDECYEVLYGEKRETNPYAGKTSTQPDQKGGYELEVNRAA